jgi:thiol-disulfide isomerase/thioredoxin
VEVDGQSDPDAALFERRGVADLVGRIGADAWFLVRPAAQTVHRLAPEAVERRGERAIALLAEPSDSGQALTLTPSGLTFDIAGHWLRVIPTPELLGKTTPEEFLGMCPEFQEREEAYEPDTAALEQIRSCDRDVTLEIYFGSWCPHCQQVLPELFKCLRLAENDRVKVELIGLPRRFGGEPEVRQREIRGVPTVIVLEGGKEIGRFSGGEKVPIETTLASVLHG